MEVRVGREEVVVRGRVARCSEWARGVSPEGGIRRPIEEDSRCMLTNQTIAI